MNKRIKRQIMAMLLLLAIVTLLISFYKPYAWAIIDTTTYEEPSIASTMVESTTEVPTTESATEILIIEPTTVEVTTEESTTEEPTTEPATEVPTTEPKIEETIEVLEWQGTVLNPSNGTVEGPSGKETYYNLDMSGVISIMKSNGYDYEYSIREDGVKMYGSYVMCAANLDLRPRGTIIETSLGRGIVCDTGSFAVVDPTRLDIAVNW